MDIHDSKGGGKKMPFEEDALYQCEKDIRKEKLVSERFGGCLASPAGVRGPRGGYRNGEKKNQRQRAGTWDVPE